MGPAPTKAYACRGCGKVNASGPGRCGYRSACGGPASTHAGDLLQTGLSCERGLESGGRFDGELGYGLAAEPGTITPYAGVGLAGENGRKLRLGARWTLESEAKAGLEASRGERDTAPRDHALFFRVSARW